MKNLVLGMMICAVSSSFAQTEVSSGVIKDRLKVKQEMQVMRGTDVVDRNELPVQSREAVKSSEVDGVIRVKNGTPFIDLEGSGLKRRMYAVNLPKQAAVDGQKIRFTYTIENAAQPTNGKCDQVIRIYDVSTVIR